MRPHHPPGRHARILATGGALLLAIVAAGTNQQPVTARPASTRAELPERAFSPLVLTPTAIASEASSPVPESTASQVPESAVPPVPAPTRPPGPIHRVRPGDTLWEIARWHRVELAVILRWNPDATADALVAGQRIQVPGGAPMPTPSARLARRAPARSTTPTVRAPRTAHRWPLPIRGLLTTRFSGAHPGIDIAAPAGTPVRAIARGTVVFAGWKDNGGGNVIVLRHPDGMTSTYNHNASVDVSIGDQVAPGQRIARVGSTGRSTGPHLDLRIEMDGRLVNPLRLF